MVTGKMPTSLETIEDRSRREVVEAYRSLVVRSLPRVPLSTRAFAEKYIRLATGPYRGEAFRVDRQPFTGLLFDQFDLGQWPTIYVTGPSQSSKTLSAFVIPTLRDVAELREDALIGVPEADMADDKWQRDFVPTLRESPELSWLLPQRGPGSRGGTVKDRITLGNGVAIKIMTRGGQDTAKAGYTASRIRVTEAAGWSHAAEASTEADPLRQLSARMRSFKRWQRSLIVEGTTTVEEELPWRARGADEDDRPISSRSRLVVPCAACEEWVTPEREHLVGWQNAATETEAQDKAAFLCPACAVPFTEEGRRAANAQVQLLHHGQTIDKQGAIHGDQPPTSTLWFRWTAFNNCLLDAADTAVDEWKAAQIPEGTAERNNAERELCQFCHAVPFRSDLEETDILKPERIRRQTGSLAKNILPADTVNLTIGCDLGDWTGWWVAVAWRANGSVHIPAYGAFDIKREKNDDLEERMIHALQDFQAGVGDFAFPVDCGTSMTADAIWIDINYQPDYCAQFLRTTGKMVANRYRGCRGRGESTNFGRYSHQNRITRQRIKIGLRWFLEVNHKLKIAEAKFDADFWKVFCQDRFRGGNRERGGCTLFAPQMKNEHAKFAQHVCSEQRVKKWDSRKGQVNAWHKTGQNHWLDCFAMACAAGDYVGYRIASQADSEAEVGESQDSEQAEASVEAASQWSRLRRSLGSVADQE